MNAFSATPGGPDLGLDGEYEILGELGRGSASVVYLARDRVLDRKVAIKVIRDALLEDEAITRLEREARLLASLQHPNIVTLYAAKRLPAGSLALVIQHGNWRTLKNALREDSPLSLAQIESILRDIGSALLYLHQNGGVHRDVKPENIFLERETGRALLSDFGIAKYRDGQASVTLTGVVIGTPVYMAPEQIDGGELDERSDLYSLGMVGYEMVTGRRPWEGESLYSVIFKQKNERLPSLRSVRDDIPDQLCEAIERALEKRPQDRWSGMDEFLSRLSDTEDAAGSTPHTQLVPVREVSAPVQQTPVAQVYKIVAEAEAEASARSVRTRRRVVVGLTVALLVSGGAGALAVVGDLELPGGLRAPDALTHEALAASAPETSSDLGAADPDYSVMGMDPYSAIDTSAPEAVPSNPAPAQAAGTSAVPGPLATTGGASEPAERQPAPSRETPAATRAPVETPVDSQLSRPLVPIAPQVVRSGATTARASTDVVLRTFAPPASGASTAAPQLLNRSDIGRLLNEYHPAELRARGVGGTVVLSALVAEDGSAIYIGVAATSGHAALDTAAVEIGKLLRFTPARDFSVARRVWVNVPLTFSGRPRDSQDEAR